MKLFRVTNCVQIVPMIDKVSLKTRGTILRGLSELIDLIICWADENSAGEGELDAWKVSVSCFTKERCQCTYSAHQVEGKGGYGNQKESMCGQGEVRSLRRKKKFWGGRRKIGF